MDELESIYSAVKDKEYQEFRRAAALKGINLDEKDGDDDYQRVVDKANAKLSGKTEEEYRLNEIGIGLEFIE